MMKDRSGRYDGSRQQRHIVRLLFMVVSLANTYEAGLYLLPCKTRLLKYYRIATLLADLRNRIIRELYRLPGRLILRAFAGLLRG